MYSCTIYIIIVCCHSSLIRVGLSMSVRWWRCDSGCGNGYEDEPSIFANVNNINVMVAKSISDENKTRKRNHLHALKPLPNHFLLFQVIYFSSGAVYFFYRCLLLSIFGFIHRSIHSLSPFYLLYCSHHILFSSVVLSTFTFYSYQTNVKWLCCNAALYSRVDGCCLLLLFI